MPSNRHNLTMDEQSFQGLLSAAYTIQEHNRRLNQSQPAPAESEVPSQAETHVESDVGPTAQGVEAGTADARILEPPISVESKSLVEPQVPAEEETRAICAHCGAAKTDEQSCCESWGLDGLRPGERMQRNWASMWLMSQEQQGLWLARTPEEAEAMPTNGSPPESRRAPRPLSTNDSAASGILAAPVLNEISEETGSRERAQQDTAPEKSTTIEHRDWVKLLRDKSQPFVASNKSEFGKSKVSDPTPASVNSHNASRDSSTQNLSLDDLTIDRITRNNPVLGQVIEKATPRSNWDIEPAENKIVDETEQRDIQPSNGKYQVREELDRNIKSIELSANGHFSGLGTNEISKFDLGDTRLGAHLENRWSSGIDTATIETARIDRKTTGIEPIENETVDTETSDAPLIEAPSDASSMTLRFSALGVKLRFHRADLYLGLAVFVSAIALLWPTGSSPQHPTLGLWDRALITMGIAEAPAPAVHLQGDPTIEVWVDPHTALYYCPGEEQYSKTPDGRLSTQREAQMDQFEPASRSACD
jgi:hypothetical protein